MTTLAVATVLAIPAGAGAAKPQGLVAALAAGECVREKAASGRSDFRKRYGQRRAMAACIRAHRGAAGAAVSVATATCHEEFEANGENFLLEWASFNECVLTYAEWHLDGGLVEDPGVEAPGVEEVEE